MPFWQILVLAVGLSMDAVAVSLAASASMLVATDSSSSVVPRLGSRPRSSSTPLTAVQIIRPPTKASSPNATQ